MLFVLIYVEIIDRGPRLGWTLGTYSSNEGKVQHEPCAILQNGDNY